MSNILEEGLNEILRQKNEYIIPENIKKGINIFNTAGNAEIFNIKNNAKIYSTKEELEADHDVEIGTKALVYGHLPFSIKEAENINSLYLPNKITLSNPIDTTHTFTCNADFDLTLIKTSASIDCSITPTMITIQTPEYNIGTGNIPLGFQIYYYSEDGIEFTRDYVNLKESKDVNWNDENNVLSWSDNGMYADISMGFIKKAILKNINFSNIDVTCHEILKTIFPILGGFYEFGQNGYEICKTQVTVANNYDIFPDKIAISSNGETLIGDNTIFDHFNQKDILEGVYNQELIPATSIYYKYYNGYDFYNIATLNSSKRNKIQFIKKAIDLSKINDGCFGTIDNYTALHEDRSEYLLYNSYTNIATFKISVKYRIVITTQYDDNDNNKKGAIVVYNYDTKEVIYHSNEFNDANKCSSDFVGDDYILLYSYLCNSSAYAYVLDLENLNIKTTIFSLSNGYGDARKYLYSK